MSIDVINPIQQTIIFGVAFFAILFLTMKRKQGNEIFPLETTNEIKGFALIAIVLSHIGYFLVSDTKFLAPFSNFAGVAVDLFLMLSGFGLALSSFKKQLGIKEFYKKRLSKIFLPMWIVFFSFLLIDFFILHKTYPLQDIIKNILGFFPHADIYGDIDSPLWYITLTLFYYILFPLFFSEKKPILSALALYLCSWIFLQFSLPVSQGVLSLYNLHFFAFPLGIILSVIFQSYESKIRTIMDSVYLRRSIFIFSVLIFLFFAQHQAVGKDPLLEQSVSLCMGFFVIIFFLFKKIQFRLLSIVGAFSYEIYLLHWPLLYRYDFLFQNMSPTLAIFLFGFLCSILAILLQYIVTRKNLCRKKRS